MTANERRAAVMGTGSCLPDRVLSNFDLEKMVETSDDWIFTRTGIRERRVIDNGTVTSDLAAEAARRALADASVAADEIDLIICATISPDYPMPSTACIVQSKLGAKRVGAFDVSAACSGFVYSLQMGAAYIGANPAATVLVIGAEALTRITDYTDRTSCILFGDGAGAVVLRAAADGRGFLWGELGADGSGAEMMYIPGGGTAAPTTHDTVDRRLQYMRIRGREVFKFAVTKFGDLMENALRAVGLTTADVSLVVPHQVNVRIINAAAERIGLSLDKVYVNIDRVGNTSGASIPIALDEANRKGLIKPGDVVLLLAFGAGLTWSSAVLRW